MSGTKYDTNKPKLSYVPTEAIVGMAKAFAYGADKYTAHNFKGGIEYTRLIDSLLRHVFAFKDGEDIDPESGLSHVDHIGTNFAMLAYMQANRPEFDNRYFKTTVGKKEVVVTEDSKEQSKTANTMTIEESDMMFFNIGTVIRKEDGRTWKIDVNGTYPVKKGDVVVYASKI